MHAGGLKRPKFVLMAAEVRAGGAGGQRRASAHAVQRGWGNSHHAVRIRNCAHPLLAPTHPMHPQVGTTVTGNVKIAIQVGAVWVGCGGERRACAGWVG